jgi:hypothetical protein
VSRNVVFEEAYFEPEAIAFDRATQLHQNYIRTEERFYERAVKKKVSPKPPKVLGS